MLGIATKRKRIKESPKSYEVSYAAGINTDPGDETALIINKHFFILNGDWIDEYKNCESRAEQVQLFKDNFDEHCGFWTEPVEDIDNAVNSK